VGETAEQASLREVEEESGLAASEPRLVRTLPCGELLLIWPARASIEAQLRSLSS
jgi:NADH pyrophosphatase NudC (nudix superfamily)